MTKALIGSVADVAETDGKSLAEAFAGVEYVILMDTSGSMHTRDVETQTQGLIPIDQVNTFQMYQSRYDAACKQLGNLQRKYPGALAVISFSSEVVFCGDGVPDFLGRSTAMHRAFEFLTIAQIQDTQMGVVVVSDGCPDSEQAALDEALKLHKKIHTIYIGADEDGERFMRELANLTGGQRFVGTLGQGLLEEKVTLLLEAGKAQLTDAIQL